MYGPSACFQVNVPDRGIIVLQHILIWPMLFVALVNWQAQSVIHLIQYPAIPAKERRCVHSRTTLALPGKRYCSVRREPTIHYPTLHLSLLYGHLMYMYCCTAWKQGAWCG